MTPLSDLRRTVRLALLLRLRAGRFVALTHAPGAAIYDAAGVILTRAADELTAAMSAAEGSAS